MIAYTCGGGICTINPDGSGNQRLAPALEGSDPAWSPDGTKIAFTGGSGNSAEIYVMQADGSLLHPVTVNQVEDQDPTWSADGSKIVFSSARVPGDPTAVYLFGMNADGSQQTRLAPSTPDLVQLNPSWEPRGSRIAYSCSNQGFYNGICIVNSDGTGRSFLGPGGPPSWLPEGGRIAFHHQEPGQESADVFTMNPDGTGRTVVTSGAPTVHNYEPKFADSEKGVCLTPSSCPPFSSIVTRDADGTDPDGLTSQPQADTQPDWQPLRPSAYPRPLSAGKLRVSLVPAYASCGNPNRTHGPPLDRPSCSPPALASQHLTVGGANGTAANFAGSARVSAIEGDPSTSADDADVRLRLSLADVRTTDLGDYTGELLSSQTLRLTDRTSGAATVEDVTYSFPLQCSPTSAESIGSTCAVDTTADAVAPGAVVEGVRSIWQLGQLQVFDGGRDGVASTEPNTLFAVQGFFVP
jgi:dipeptidyl aminopeptidase/acylaminoacyl peptidase